MDIRKISRFYTKIIDDVTGYKNRVHKLFTESLFNLSCVVTDIFGVLGQIIIEGLLKKQSSEEILRTIKFRLGYRLKAPIEMVLDALEGTLSDTVIHNIKTMLKIISLLQQEARQLEQTLLEAIAYRGFNR
ncbi:MAG: hypothetical protein LBV23_03790 [Deltaproteobacteria bacterium]|nr:hypothetical protein [Deltaproteobacteria bacterium]